MQALFTPVRRAGLIACALVSLVLAGCSGSPSGPGLVVGRGTVRHETLEGGFYAIHGDDGKLYDPINLQANAQVDGQRVRFVGVSRTDLVSYRPGIIIELKSLELLP
jgi:hypothetical protein